MKTVAKNTRKTNPSAHRSTKKKTKKKDKGCNCIVEIQDLLAEHNTELVLLMRLNGEVYPSIETKKINPRTSRRPKPVIPSYCAFCGKKYASL